MISLDIIEREITELEARDTSYATVERLAWLYICRDHLHQTETDELAVTQHTSDFLTAADGVSISSLLKILDEHMDCINAICPKEYAAVCERIRGLK